MRKTSKYKKKENLEPIWQSKKTSIHPALDFVNEKAIITQLIPYLNDGKEKELLTLITSDRKLIRLNPEITDFNIVHYPLNFPRRWNLDSIKAFIESKETRLQPKRLLEELKSQFALYIEFPEIECYHFFPLWIIGTYLHSLFKAYPYVYIGGIKETGKTKVLNVCSCLAFNSIFSGNMSSASLFRLIQNNRCSLFIDETEKLSNPQRAEEFRNILLNGYKQGSFVYRVEKIGNKQQVMKFEPYSPKMLANIQGIEDVLESRCINFIMKRTLNKEVGERDVDESDKMWQILRDQLYFFTMTYWKDIKTIYDDISNDTDLKNREWELWKPIFSIAKFIHPKIYQEMIEFALRKSKEKKTENVTYNAECILAETLCELVKNDSYYSVRTIKEAMSEKYEDEEKWLNNKWIGRALTRLGFKNKRRIGTGIEWFLTISEVKELAERLGVYFDFAPTQTTENTQTTLKSSVVSEVNEVSEFSKTNE